MLLIDEISIFLGFVFRFPKFGAPKLFLLNEIWRGKLDFLYRLRLPTSLNFFPPSNPRYFQHAAFSQPPDPIYTGIMPPSRAAHSPSPCGSSPSPKGYPPPVAPPTVESLSRPSATSVVGARWRRSSSPSPSCIHVGVIRHPKIYCVFR